MPNNLSNDSKLLPSISQLPRPNLNQNILPPIRIDSQSSESSMFRCKTCLKAFNRKNSLTRHERIHTGLRPYSCTICNKNFGRKDVLEGHKLSIKCQRSTQYYMNFYLPRENTENTGTSYSDRATNEYRRHSIEYLLSNNNVDYIRNGEEKESSSDKLEFERFKLLGNGKSRTL